MATTELDAGPHRNTDFDSSRRLSVVDTLAQATKALQTHRAWMKRRISIAPINEGETANRDHQVNDVFVRDSVRDDVSLEDLFEAGPFGVSNNREVIHSAPPPFSRASSGAVSLGQRSTTKRHLAHKVSPASLRDLPDLPEEKLALTGVYSPPSLFYGTSDPAAASSGKYDQSTRISDEAFGASSRGSQNESLIPQPQASKKKPVSSKGRVVPAVGDSVKSVVTSPTSPKEIFYGGSLSPSSLPTHLSSLVTSGNAWGSVETLENHEATYRDSTSETEQTSHSPTFVKHLSRETFLCHSVPEEQSEKSSLEENMSGQEESLKMSEQRNVTENSHTVTAERLESSLEHTVDDQTDSYELQTNHFESLQANSSTKILPVSPAPKDQRSSYFKHTQSKVSTAEESLEIIDREPGTKLHTGMEQPLSLRLPVTPNHHHGRQIAVGTASEATIQPVLPKQRERKMGTVLVTRHKLVTSPTTSSPSLISTPFESGHQPPLVQGRQEDLEYLEISGVSPKNKGAISPQVEVKENSNPTAVTSTLPTRLKNSESFLKDREISVQHIPVLGSPASPVIVAKGGSLSEVRTAWSEDAVQNEQKNEPEEALRELSLPPLKEHTVQEVSIDGSEMVRRLPPLKVQPPLSLYTTGFTFSRKRDSAPPPYTIHRLNGSLGMAPPCPVYGISQPKQLEALLSSSQRPTNLSVDYTDSSHSQTPRVEGLANKHPRQPNTPSSHNQETRIRDDNRDTTDRERSMSDDPAVSCEGERKQEDHIDDRQVAISDLPPGPSPLHLAAKSGNLRRLQSLINQGHDVDLPDQDGRTPLMYCIHSQGVHLSCADALIREGANVNKQSSDGSTAMHFASSVGAVALIELMVLNGGSTDIRDFEGRLPLHWATIQKSSKVIASLLESSDLDINATDDAGMTPLMWSSYHNNQPIMSYLLDRGADCEEKDSDGYTAMHWGVHREGTQCLELLLKPDMTYFKDHKGKTVILFAAEKGAMTVCELILKMRADAIYDTDKMGRTPLHYAAACSRVDVCALLLDRGADAAQRDSTGRTPLDYARLKKMDYVVALLTCHGTAVADFARASKSTSVSSFLNRAVSFSQLPQSPTAAEENNLLSKSLSSIHSSLTSNKNDENTPRGSMVSLRSEGVLSEGSRGGEGLDVVKGGYLGRFINDKTNPIQHFFFRVLPDQGTVLWTRQRSSLQKTAKQATILEVHEGPSNGVKQASVVYSPDDLHKYVFWIMTAGGILDLFAYNQDDYATWMREIATVAESNARVGNTGQSLRGQERIRESGVSSRPVSSHSRTSRGKIAPINPHQTEQDVSHVTDQSYDSTSQSRGRSNQGSLKSNNLFATKDQQLKTVQAPTPLFISSQDVKEHKERKPLSSKSYKHRSAVVPHDMEGNALEGSSSNQTGLSELQRKLFVTSTPIGSNGIERNNMLVLDDVI